MKFMDSAILKNQLMIMKALLPLVSDKQLANDLRGQIICTEALILAIV